MNYDWANRFDELILRLQSREIANHAELNGCTVEEIDRLQQKTKLSLPRSYRKYLKTMGHSSGKLFSHDHAAVTYADVLELTTEAYAIIESKLPPGAFAIHGRLGEQFLFIVCNDVEDSAVYYVSEWDQEIKQVCTSVVDWLDDYAKLAKDAIKSGYYDEYPNGTSP